VAGGAAAAAVAARRAAPGAGAKARSVISRVVEQVKDSSGSLFGSSDEGTGMTGGSSAGGNGGSL
jgi:hypothetical protein